MQNIKEETNYKKILKDEGYKCTPARMNILKIFFNNKIPLDAEKIHKMLSKNKQNNNINEATIYRTISAFEQSGILKRIDIRKDSIHFELNNDHHHHIVCLKCGEIEDFKENKKIEKILGRIVENSSKFKKLKEHSLELFGYCKDCLLVTN